MVVLASDQRSAATEVDRLRARNADQERKLQQLRAEVARFRQQVDYLRAANDELGREKRQLQASLDGYVSRAQASCVFGPLEMTAGTHVGPRRRDVRRQRS